MLLLTSKTPFSVRLLPLAVMAAFLGVTPFDTRADSDDDELLAFVSVAAPAPVASPGAPVPARPAVAVQTTPAPAPSPAKRPTGPFSQAERPVAPGMHPVTLPAIKEQAPIVTPAPSRPVGNFFRPVMPAVTPQPRVTEIADAPAAIAPATPAYVAPVSAQPVLTPLPDVAGQVATPRRSISGAPSETEIRTLFSNAVRQAIRISPRISSSRYQSEAALGSVDEAKGQRWPQVDVTSNSKSLYFGGGARSGRNSSDVPSVGINMATTLYDFGHNSNTIRTREDQAKAAQVGILAEEENTAWEVSNAMIGLSKQRLIIGLSQDYVTRMKELTNMLSGIVAVDQGRRSELTQAKGRLLSAQSSLDAAVSQARDSEIVLYRLLGESQVALPPAGQWNLSLPNLNSQLSLLERHPTVLKAQAEAKASLSEAAAVRSSGLPKLNWVVSKNTGKDELGRTQAFETGLQVSWGLFRGGSNSAAERAAIARAESNRHLVDEQLRDLEQRVRGANQDAGSLLERADLYQNLKGESDRIRLAFFEQWYHLGKRTLLDVLSAESDYYNNRVSEVSSRFDGYAAIMRSYASSGQLIDWLNNPRR